MHMLEVLEFFTHSMRYRYIITTVSNVATTISNLPTTASNVATTASNVVTTSPQPDQVNNPRPLPNIIFESKTYHG